MARAPANTDIELFPEADCLEGFPHPRETNELFGHETAIEHLAEGFASGRMHHGWLLTGTAGIGKATLAYRLARYVLAGENERHAAQAPLTVDPAGQAARQVLALSHPRLLLLRRPYDQKAKRFATAITVNEVRRLRGFLSHRGDADAWRVVIVDSADELNINAANALLKSLEEPPPRTLFLLISSQPGRLLNTIRSRCRRLDLFPLTPDQLTAAIAQARISADMPPASDQQLEGLIRLSGGSVRRALALDALGGLELAAKADEVIAALPMVRWDRIHALADDLSPAAANERFEVFYDYLLERLAAVIRHRAGARTDKQNTADLEPLANRVIRDGQLASWACLWETLARTKADAFALNLDRKALILDTASRLEAAANGQR